LRGEQAKLEDILGNPATLLKRLMVKEIEPTPKPLPMRAAP
jgi:hypothetical protein